jgi:hypothetical protein
LGSLSGFKEFVDFEDEIPLQESLISPVDFEV